MLLVQKGRPEDENQGVNNMKNADYNFLLNVCSILHTLIIINYM
jgi:hypothetical protein